MSRKKTYKVDFNASTGGDDRFGVVYDGMMSSDAFKKLSCGLRLFYIACRVQAKSKQGTSCLYKHGQESGTVYDENCFVFPASHLQRYGYDRSDGNKYLRGLIAAGFIKKVESNKSRFKVSVYRFSSQWRTDSK